MDRPTIVHISCDYPDPLEATKTRSVKNLIENTLGVRHVIYSLNRVTRLGGIVSMDFGPDQIAVAYGAPPSGLLHATRLDAIADWIVDDIQRRGLKVDAFHLHKFSVEGLMGARLAKATHRPFIVNIWGDTDLKIVKARADLAARWKAILRDAAAIIPCAPWAEDKIHDMFGLDRSKATVLAPIVFHETFHASAPTDQPRFVTLFKLDSHVRKNLPSLVTAMVGLAKSNPDVRLDIYGSGSPKTLFAVRKVIADAEAASIVTLKGPLDNAVFTETLNKYTAFVMPSRRETFGMVFIEALFSGLPLLHTRGWGIDGFFPDETVGYAARAPDLQDIKQGLTYLIDNQGDLKASIAKFNAVGGLEPFKRDTIVASYRRVIDTVLSGAGQI